MTEKENNQQNETQEQQNNDSLVDKQRLKNILVENFPPLEFAFGYGSGVFAQKSYNYQKEKPMIDMIFVVENIEEFHCENLKQNPSHYSGMGKILGAKYLDFLQRHVLPIHFNPMIQIQDDIQIKYGVIEKRKFLRDLKSWDTLICAGRMHKPIKIILNNEIDGKIKEAMAQNLLSATCVSLLLNYQEISTQLGIQSSSSSSSSNRNSNSNSKKNGIKDIEQNKGNQPNQQVKGKYANPFQSLSQSQPIKQEIKQQEICAFLNLQQFYFTLTSLSYVGDVRMSLGAENVNKIDNIISGNKQNFDKLYKQVFSDRSLSKIIKFSDLYEDQLDVYLGNEQNINFLIDEIPLRLAQEYTGVEKDCYESLKRIEPINVSAILSDCIKKKNKFYSKRMILYNILSTSMLKNSVYALQKLKKGILKR